MTTFSRAFATLLATGLMTSLAAFVPAGAAIEVPLAKVAASTLTPGDPMSGEEVIWTAQTTAKKKMVDLQLAKGSKWKTLTSVRTDATGNFVLPIVGGKTGTVAKYRVSRDDKTLVRRKVTTVEQTVVLGPPTLSGLWATMTATYSPVRSGRRGVLMVLSAYGWGTNVKGRRYVQDAAGQITFTALTGPYCTCPPTYAASSVTYNGAAEALSNSQVVAGTPFGQPQ